MHWDELPVALYPDSLGAIFSGTAVIDYDNTSGFGRNGHSLRWLQFILPIAPIMKDSVLLTALTGDVLLPNMMEIQSLTQKPGGTVRISGILKYSGISLPKTG